MPALMVGFPGVLWWQVVDDMPHEVWQDLMDVIAARVKAAQRAAQQTRRR